MPYITLRYLPHPLDPALKAPRASGFAAIRLLRNDVILRAWFVRQGHYLERTKTFVLGFVLVFVLAHEQAISIPWVVDCKAPQFPIQIKGVGCDFGTLRGTLAVSDSSRRAGSELDSLFLKK